MKKKTPTSRTKGAESAKKVGSKSPRSEQRPKVKKSKAEAKSVAKPSAKGAAKPAKPAAKASKPAKAEAKAGKAVVASKPASKAAAKPAREKPAKAAKPAKVEKAAAPVTKVASAPEAPKAGKPAGAAQEKPGGRKGITIVTPKRPKASKPKTAPAYMLSATGSGAVLPRKPLIPSGPNASVPASLDMADPAAKKKSPFNKSQLERFRKILLEKRRELAGEVHGLEHEALRGSSGSLSHTPSHMAEQGSEAADQALSLDLAAAERKLIREIDEALKRIEEGVYGLCEFTGKPIPVDRLEELPWTRYSIDAARELERRTYAR